MGGRLDPKTGQTIWDARVPIEQQPTFYNNHPPRALDGLTCTPVEPPDWKFDGHGEPVNAVFELACPCGSKLFTVISAFDEDGAKPPIAVACSGCASERVVFDASKHGYDGALGNHEPDESIGEIDDLVSEEIGAPHHVLVRFEFPSDVLGDEEWRGREQDLFSWVTILARDPATGHLAFLFDAECA
jgi:hypothetical protein